MKLSIAFLALGLSMATALELGIRGAAKDQSTEPGLQCAIEGSASEDACLNAEDEDGNECVWCSFSTLNACVSADQAEVIEEKLPMVTCSNDDDDDDAPPEDDDAPPEDDDAPAEDDDSSPDDYWKCLKQGDNEEDCSGLGCTWCMTGAGYGICLDGEAAKQADKSDWVQCGADIDAAIVATSAKEFAVKNPYDVTCVAATAEGDSETCKQTVDEDGQPCEWCSLQAHEFCLSDEQAQIFEQLGATCDDDATPSILSVVKDIQDITCIAQSTEDEVTCESTIDEDGNACEFCTISDYNLCLTGDQATLAEQLGVSCGDDKRKQPVLESS